LDVYLELGSKRVFAVAVDWPGWARAGTDEEAALEQLLAYGARYKRAMGSAAGSLGLPKTAAGLKVIGRETGGASTDFGVPGAVAKVDERPTSEEDLDRLIRLLKAAWRTFAKAAEAAEGVELAPSGPRGGGRSLAKIREHVAEAEGSYLGTLGGRYYAKRSWEENQGTFVEALRARAHGDLPDHGPRGGKRWPARYAVRRSAWHALDHAWEIEDRAER
jgi:hypothetical protein